MVDLHTAESNDHTMLFPIERFKTISSDDVEALMQEMFHQKPGKEVQQCAHSPPKNEMAPLAVVAGCHHDVTTINSLDGAGGSSLEKWS